MIRYKKKEISENVFFNKSIGQTHDLYCQKFGFIRMCIDA